MTIYQNLLPQTRFAQKQKRQVYHLPEYLVKWRQGQLFIKLSQQANEYNLSVIEDKQFLVECLKNSSAKLLRVEHNLGETKIKVWADASEQAKKVVFLQLPSNNKLPNKQGRISWVLKRLIDWVAAALLLLALSPLMLGLILLISIYMPGPIFFRQWRVGQRGKLFQIIKFRTMVVDAEKLHHQVMGNQTGLHKLIDDPRITGLGRWMRKYSIDELPQLLNVLRGEMSLVGPRPWALYDALRISPEGQKRLNALPGHYGALASRSQIKLIRFRSS
jgi:lipopolysaccharide/colanic/teichoic acid biosynthesis glycosyltransferase